MLDEQELIRRCVAGDQAAFRQLLTIYKPTVERICSRDLRNGDVDDLVQEVFTKVHLHLPSYEYRGFKLGAWITRVTINACINHIRKRKKETVDQDVIEGAVQTNWRAEIDFFEFSHSIEGVLSRLPESRREVLILRGQGMNYAEIAEELGIPVGTVMSRLFRAKRDFRQEQDLQRNPKEKEMEKNKPTRSADYRAALVFLIEIHFRAEWITGGMVNAISGIQEITGFKVFDFINTGLRLGHFSLIPVKRGKNGAPKWRINQGSPEVRQIAMECGLLTEEPAEDTAVDDEPEDTSKPQITKTVRVSGSEHATTVLTTIIENFGVGVISMKKLARLLELQDKRWKIRYNLVNVTTVMRKNGILLKCRKDGTHDPNSRGYGRLNPDHPEVQELLQVHRANSGVVQVMPVSFPDQDLIRGELDSLTIKLQKICTRRNTIANSISTLQKVDAELVEESKQH